MRIFSDISRYLFRRVCRRLHPLSFKVTYWDGVQDRFGPLPAEFHLTFRRWQTLWRVLLAPDPAIGESYMNGDLEIEPLSRALEVCLSHPAVWKKRKSPLTEFRGPSISVQAGHVQSHYDRGNEFFSTWLDSSRTYSCAYFRGPTDTLDQAQKAKIEHVLKKAHLRPGQHLLDIGSGWGTLIMEAARRYGVHCLGITLSRQQYEFTQKAIHEAGLEDRVKVKLIDYRKLEDEGRTFDRIISVGMMEHVGRKNLPTFLKTIGGMLCPGGICVLHSMTRLNENVVSPWIRKYIFPGTYVPSWREVISLFPEFNLHLIDTESLRLHYAMTLKHWAERFEGSLSRVREIGFDESFIRMWRLYLHSCAQSFQTGRLDLHQYILTRHVNNQLPWTRDYLYQSVENREELPCFEDIRT